MSASLNAPRVSPDSIALNARGTSEIDSASLSGVLAGLVPTEANDHSTVEVDDHGVRTA